MSDVVKKTTGDPLLDGRLHRALYDAALLVRGYGWDSLFDEKHPGAFWLDFLQVLRLHGYETEAKLLEEAREIMEAHQMPAEECDDLTLAQIENLKPTPSEQQRLDVIQTLTRPLFDALLTKIDFSP